VSTLAFMGGPAFQEIVSYLLFSDDLFFGAFYVPFLLGQRPRMHVQDQFVALSCYSLKKKSSALLCCSFIYLFPGGLLNLISVTKFCRTELIYEA
jgi:hypothetical protein